jgi:hypothetical protein
MLQDDVVGGAELVALLEMAESSLVNVLWVHIRYENATAPRK